MEQSTPCQPAMTRVPGHVNKQRQHGQPLPATLPFRNILEVGSRAPALVQGAWLCRVKPFSELNQRSSTAAKREAPLGYWGKRDQVGGTSLSNMQSCTLWGVEFCAGQEIKYLYGKEKESAFERTSPSLKQDPMNHEQRVSTTLAAAETMDKDVLAPMYNRVLDCISCQDSRPIDLGAQTQVCMLTLPQSTETHRFWSWQQLQRSSHRSLSPWLWKAGEPFPGKGLCWVQSLYFGKAGARILVKVSFLCL